MAGVIERIVRKYQGLMLTEEENERIKTDDLRSEAATPPDHILVGKIFSPRRFQAKDVKDTFARVWMLGKSLQCRPLAPNIFQFEFQNPIDRNRVFEEQPWIYEGFLLALRKPYRGMIAARMSFDHSLFWIHVHGLPDDLMNEKTAAKIGNKLGKFVKVEKDADGSMVASYIRIRCEINVTKPIRRRQMIEDLGKELQLVLRYEKLPDFCTFCGIMGHVQRDCLSEPELPAELRREERYPPELWSKPYMSPFFQPGGRQTDTLATTENLRRRTMSVSTVCALCQADNGSSAHLFFDCPAAKEIWDAVGLWGAVERGRCNRGELWFRGLITSSDLVTCEVIITVCDNVWFRRNQKIFKDQDMDSRVLAATLTRNLQTFHDARGWPERASASLHVHSLLRPPDGRIKFSFDGGLSENTACLGVVVQDEQGEILRVVSRKEHGVNDSTLAEGLAFLEALNLAVRMDIKDPVFVGDALTVVQMVRHETDPTITCLHLMELCCSVLEEHDFTPPFWVPRDLNHLADSVARFTKTSSRDFHVWDSVPQFLLSTDTGRFPVP